MFDRENILRVTKSGYILEEKSKIPNSCPSFTSSILLSFILYRLTIGQYIGTLYSMCI